MKRILIILWLVGSIMIIGCGTVPNKPIETNPCDSLDEDVRSALCN